MGNQNVSTIVDEHGQQVVRKCIILVIPPGFQVHKMIEGFHEEFPYRYVSVGQLIRNQINKKTKYSKIILQSLQKHKKISSQLLEMILKTVALRGNFIIRYSVLDSEELNVWKNFMSKIEVQMIAIIKSSDHQDNFSQEHHSAKQHMNQRLKGYINDIKTAKLSFVTKNLRQFNQSDDIASEIMNFIRKNNS